MENRHKGHLLTLIPLKHISEEQVQLQALIALFFGSSLFQVGNALKQRGAIKMKHIILSPNAFDLPLVTLNAVSQHQQIEAEFVLNKPS
jgi:hypothetical protein